MIALWVIVKRSAYRVNAQGKQNYNSTNTKRKIDNMETTEEKRATFTPGPWQLSCIDGVEDSLMVGGGDDGSDIVADIRGRDEANDFLD